MRNINSDIAYHQIKESLPHRRAEAFELVWKHPQSTAAELVSAAGLRSAGGRGMAGNLHARLNELMRQGVVQQCGVRACKVTGHQVSIYEATGRMPSGPAKRPKRKGLSGTSERFLDELWRQHPTHRYAIGLVQRLAKEHAGRRP